MIATSILMAAALLGTMILPMAACGRTMPAAVQPPPPQNDSDLQSVVRKAKDDLARRLSVPAEQINIVGATEVEWSDSSLDCPQPGMAYLQVITPGYRIVLESGGNRYEYHSNRDVYIVYCETAVPQIPSNPAK